MMSMFPSSVWIVTRTCAVAELARDDASNRTLTDRMATSLIAVRLNGKFPVTPAATPMELKERLKQALGTTYSIERELGGAGMSRVFGAREIALGRAVVIKVLHAEMAGQVSAERFKREITLAARLQ